MERSITQGTNCTTDFRTDNEKSAYTLLQSAIDCGVEEFCICPGGRTAPLMASLATQDFATCYWGFEERSTAFFALGRIKRSGKATAVIVTSGTAVGELLPAVMEAYYTCQPLLIISADRPQRFRGSGAPQSCEQVGIFGQYATLLCDFDGRGPINLVEWDRQGPAHINICFEEPSDKPGLQLRKASPQKPSNVSSEPSLINFLNTTSHPLVIVGELLRNDLDAVEKFLLKLNAPIILEPASGLCSRKSLQHLIIRRRRKILESAAQHGYPIDGVLRLGGVPTLRLWRDLENLEGEIPVHSVTQWPFSGLSFMSTSRCNLQLLKTDISIPAWSWPEHAYRSALEQLYQQFPRAEQTLIHQLSTQMPSKLSLYLGNSLPIREWDQFASNHFEDIHVAVNRGLNGIDGQLSTAIGFSADWVILGDLTTLYDLAAPWLLSQCPNKNIQIVVINNSGGQIFADMFKNPAFLNRHTIQFKSFAEMWSLQYEQWKTIPESITCTKSRVIELVPDAEQSRQFSAAMKSIDL